MLEQDRIDVDEKAVLILDGFDEMSEANRVHLKQTIDGIIARNLEILIIMSSRTNVYFEQTGKKELFTIKPITKEDIETFILQFGIDVSLAIPSVSI